MGLGCGGPDFPVCVVSVSRRRSLESFCAVSTPMGDPGSGETSTNSLGSGIVGMLEFHRDPRYWASFHLIVWFCSLAELHPSRRSEVLDRVEFGRGGVGGAHLDIFVVFAGLRVFARL